MKEKLTEPYL